VHVFADDSSSFGKEEFTCLAGCIARDANWARFTDEWDDLLGLHKMPRLHTSDFLAGKQGYERLKLSYEQRIAVLGEFMAVIRDHVECIVLVGMNSREYRVASKGTAKRLSPSDFLFLRFIRRCHDQMVEWGYQEPLAFIFDDNHKISPRLYSSWSHLKRSRRFARNSLAGITFGDDGLLPPLQAADLVACGLTRSQRESKLMWDLGSPFSAIFVDPAGPRLALRLVQEFWDETAFAEHRDSPLWTASEG